MTGSAKPSNNTKRNITITNIAEQFYKTIQQPENGITSFEKLACSVSRLIEILIETECLGDEDLDTLYAHMPNNSTPNPSFTADQLRQHKIGYVASRDNIEELTKEFPNNATVIFLAANTALEQLAQELEQ